MRHATTSGHVVRSNRVVIDRIALPLGSTHRMRRMAAVSRVRARPRDDRAAWSLWGLALLALATAVIAGVLAMHGLSVGHHAPVDSSAQHLVSSQPATHADTAGAQGVSCPTSSCDEPDAMGAMCVFLLQWLVLVIPRRDGSRWRWQPPWLTSLAGHPPAWLGHLSGVSLIRLCISRT